jgi:hypothetical protein
MKTFSTLAAGAAIAMLSGPAIAKSAPKNTNVTNEKPSLCLGGEQQRGGAKFNNARQAYLAYLKTGSSQFLNYGDFLLIWKATCPDG